MKNFSTPLILTVLTLIILAGGYWYFFAGSGNQQPLSTTTTTSASQSQFQTLVGELQSVSFDTSIFSDNRFNALIDITTPITPEPSGRTDPFAPVVSSTTASASANALMAPPPGLKKKVP